MKVFLGVFKKAGLCKKIFYCYYRYKNYIFKMLLKMDLKTFFTSWFLPKTKKFIFCSFPAFCFQTYLALELLKLEPWKILFWLCIATLYQITRRPFLDLSNLQNHLNLWTFVKINLFCFICYKKLKGFFSLHISLLFYSTE